MAALDLAAVCGTYCGTCRYYKLRCEGCGAVKGKPFWVKEYHREVCRLYDVIHNKVVDGHRKACISRSTFVIDKKGILRHILRDVSPKDHADEVLKAVKSLNGRAN